MPSQDSTPPSSHSGPSESLQRIWEALDRGEPEEALVLIERARDQDSAHHAAEATARMDLGDLEGARVALTNAMHAQEADIDLDILWADAELSLREWRIEVAQDRFDQLLEIEPHAALHERLALCCDLLNEPKKADEHLGQAAALDPQGFPLPPRFSEAEIDEFVRKATEALPEAFRAGLERAEVRVEPVPTRELAEAGPPGETPPDALGFFVGHSLLEDPAGDLPELPPVIYLFQRNLERACTDREQLEEELLVTLHHELAHLLGFDEDGVEALGLE